MKHTRKELIELLAELSDRHPDMRLGQLLCNLASWAEDEPHVWDATDEELIAAAQSHLTQQSSTAAKP